MAATFSADGPSFSVTSREELFPVDDLRPAGSINWDVSPDGQEFLHFRAGGAGGSDLVWILNWPEMLRELTPSL